MLVAVSPRVPPAVSAVADLNMAIAVRSKWHGIPHFNYCLPFSDMGIVGVR